MARTTVRISEDTRDKLRELARERDESMQEVLAEAVRLYDLRRFVGPGRCAAARTTVRITEETRERLRALARDCDESMQEVLAQAVEAYRRNWILEQSNAAWARLREDPVAWAAELEERRIWEGTLADGLDQE